MRKKLILLSLATLLLIPWPVAYAYDVGMAGGLPIQVEAAESSAAPSWEVFGRAIGSVTNPGDLFYIDTTDYGADVLVTLYLTNAAELIHYYRYQILKVGVYVQTGDGQWEEATSPNGELIPDIYITMRNGNVSFTLPGYAKNKITIDSGSFYFISSSPDGSSISPKFYLTVD